MKSKRRSNSGLFQGFCASKYVKSDLKMRCQNGNLFLREPLVQNAGYFLEIFLNIHDRIFSQFLCIWMLCLSIGSESPELLNPEPRAFTFSYSFPPVPGSLFPGTPLGHVGQFFAERSMFFVWLGQLGGPGTDLPHAADPGRFVQFRKLFRRRGYQRPRSCFRSNLAYSYALIFRFSVDPVQRQVFFQQRQQVLHNDGLGEEGITACNPDSFLDLLCRIQIVIVMD